eukprot:CAMPEP_0116842436 /NCGR_PEP_ID=MMETSP0418-20121206/11515_1 /TAXON_ID=1158023 /ORGANISM="Astrosyne radiata, Strain 13vi08-1A" /LENGTH=152 /DNA_ID=CAMNT_0004473045 /DNA_START=65 /DNA_END=523 /DNA_ORIENTATION=+
MALIVRKGRSNAVFVLVMVFCTAASVVYGQMSSLPLQGSRNYENHTTLAALWHAFTPATPATEAQQQPQPPRERKFPSWGVRFARWAPRAIGGVVRHTAQGFLGKDKILADDSKSEVAQQMATADGGVWTHDMSSFADIDASSFDSASFDCF